ncbi:terminase [Vreelandella aquamarina]|uniref:Phage terminase-like protein, large subunit, contains N-terminal HTH domain n=1 Tax=Vreelandella aquamarina TaxID=77097 RepID=A0A1N6HQ33_9GAMM|nr:terminase TerL endonuclease subunit [Halomonas meridiana]GED45253.1 terminase [Halomonas meridiana]SIN62238.1 Phage terminase-like protein, large subunit, contains N-terminal HTH domain [Halomonas meridiana]SIN72065.1 Phage terminase-like protein, large subunit, contains N-terminal HTH domain [Halomonas meridiana]SIO21850.1 Phage terminase-like protein, large subunit, contains N-terminal HTH domain [Halomonas meridiana]
MAAYPNVNAAQKYARDVVGGKIPACSYVKATCARHLNDQKASKAKSYPYRFDRDLAERVCRFIQKMPHTKGKWARGKQRITLEPWQLFLFSMIYGWVRKADKTRRFREAYIEVPRKNGKSIIAAGAGIYAFCADNEYGAEVYCGATSEKQAWEVFKPALEMARKLPALRKRFGMVVWAKKIERTDGSKFEPVIGDPGDGSSPSMAIIDEYHEHPDSRLYDTMITGMGARDQPLVLVITTAGFDIAGPCYGMRERSIEMLEGVQEDDELFAIVYTIDKDDDWTTRDALIKANPNAGISVGLDYLAARQQAAIKRARIANSFKTKHLNLWVSSKEGFFNMQSWAECEDRTLTLEQFRGFDCYYGFDLARKLDLTGMVRVFVKQIDGKNHYYCIAPTFWAPEDTVFNNEERRVAERYQGWVEAKQLEATDGAEIDYREVLAQATEAHEEAPAKESGIDPHGAANLSHQLDDAGMNPVTIQQSYTHMSDPMKELEAAILTGRFHHDGHPIMTWCVGNVVGKYLPGNDDVVRPIKQGDHNKIDGAVALIMAIGRAMNAAQSGGSVLDSLSDDDILVM